jgi:CRP-like cAMP-binding protein
MSASDPLRTLAERLLWTRPENPSESVYQPNFGAQQAIGLLIRHLHLLTALHPWLNTDRMLADVRRTRNLLLANLSREDFAYLEPNLERVPLHADAIMLEPSAAIERIYFPEGGVVSFHEISQDGSRVGVAIIGFEGFTGWPALLGIAQSPHEATVAIGGGTALSIAATDLVRACGERQAIHALLLRYVHCFMSQMGRTIMSNLNDALDKRLARWLLMNHDRLEGDRIDLTHKQLGVMLGVRRSTVTDTVHVLEGKQLIRSTRGVIEVRDRAQLLVFAGESYGAAETEYARFIAPFAKSCGSPIAHTGP